MKNVFSVIAFLLTLLLFLNTAEARGVHVRGYTTRSGHHVAPHMRTSPDHSRLNNWSTKGNINPYTGKAGTKNP